MRVVQEHAMPIHCARFVLIAAGLALAGCERPPGAAASPPVPVAAAADPAPATGSDATSAPQGSVLPLLALSEDGLDLVDADSGSIRHLEFALPFADVLAILVRLRGEPGERGINEDCGAGALDIARWSDGLRVLGQDGGFAGWSLDGSVDDGPTRTGATTVDGIGLGTTRSELESLQAVEVGESSLGTEFAAGGLYGVLASDQPEAVIVGLWAGVSCIAR
jgi:hypothetical protein